jgi:hypothetical protein
MCILSNSDKVKKITRSRPLIPQSDLNDYKRKYQEEIKEKYDILRNKPAIIKLV